MADTSDIRSKIHTFWEAFFPSSAYFVLFIWIFFVFIGGQGIHTDLSALHAALMAFDKSPTYQALQKFELHKLLPLVVLFVAAFAVYIFDRLVSVIGDLLPPFTVWRGNHAAFINKGAVLTLWFAHPQKPEVSSLDSVARGIIEEALTNGKTLPDKNRISYLDDQFSKAGRLFTYAKAGLLWIFVLFTVALARGGPLGPKILSFVFFQIFFLVLGVVGMARMTRFLLLKTQEDYLIAARLLRMSEHHENNGQQPSPAANFDTQFARCIEHSQRFVRLEWKFRGDWMMLYYAFFGFSRKSKSRRYRKGEL